MRILSVQYGHKPFSSLVWSWDGVSIIADKKQNLASPLPPDTPGPLRPHKFEIGEGEGAGFGEADLATQCKEASGTAAPNAKT